MSDPPKSGPTFSFGTPATNGGSSNLFGQAFSSTSNPPNSGFFGTSNNPPSTSSSNLFGSNTSTAPTNPSFESNTQQKPSQFGGGQQASGGGSIFGGGGESTSSELRGASRPTSNASNAGSSAFAGFSTPSKTAETSGAGHSSGLFNTAGSTGGGGLFGNASSSASSAQANATPASKPSTGFSFGSTTPAGPPPSSNAGTGGATGSLFNFNKPQEGSTTNPSNILGNSGAGKSSALLSGGTAAPSNHFGSLPQPSGGLFGSSKPSESNATTSSAQPSGSLFGASQSNSSPSLFGNNAAPRPGGGLFSNLNKPQGSGDIKPQGDTAKSSLFPNLDGQSSGPMSSSSSADTASKPTFTFPLTKSQPGVEDAAPAPTTAPSGFGSFGQPTTSGASTTTPAAASTIAPTGGVFASLGGASTPSATPSAGGIFSNLGKDKGTIDQNTTSTTAPSSTSAIGTSLNFGDLGKSATSAATPLPTTQAPSTSTTSGIAAANANLGASTSGPPPTAQSRLKNKSMDEIITRWASDLSKYQKEFQKQAERVAAWDRMLVENSEKIQKLYGSTLEAERATTEVERQLSAVENDQNELELWLDHYEKEVDTLTASQIGHGDSLQGPDQERERTYNLAERLSDRLDEMGKDLGSMIEEINDASSTLNKTSKADDPLSQVVRVLNSHLTQLQQIDQGAAALQLKVATAQKAGQTIGTSNGFDGPVSDAADGFYRSYMGRR